MIYSLEIWDVTKASCITVLEEKSDTIITDLDYRDGYFSYWTKEPVIWLIDAVEPNEATLHALDSLESYFLEQNGAKVIKTAIIPENLGNWSNLLSINQRLYNEE